MIDVFVVPDVAGQTVTVTGTIAAERFVLSTKFGSFYSIVLKAQGGADEIPKFTLGGSAVLDMGDGNDKVQLETEALDAALGSGNDELRGYGGNGCVIDAGPGNDTVRCAGDSVQIDGGTGDDTLTAAAPQAGFLIKGGPGDDKLYALKHVDGGEGGFRNEAQRVKQGGSGRLCQARRAVPGAG
jgi:Ca2+-binding RTX toxin-like protein